jgi:anaerobic selenocysteine-containing dehydrogenase
VLVCGTVPPGTPSGKVELYSEDMQQRYGYGVPRYEPIEATGPLMLITPSSSKRTNATFGGGTESAGMEEVEIHPQDAAARGVGDGDRVLVRNRLGEVVLRARISEAVQPGVLYSPKGTWLATSATGMTVNALLDADIRTDILDGACYNDTFVELVRDTA